MPAIVWDYKLGNRSALEWVLDQYKESKPKDPTIREKFNTYQFADYKEHVIDLLMRVCTVSVNAINSTRHEGARKRLMLEIKGPLKWAFYCLKYKIPIYQFKIDALEAAWILPLRADILNHNLCFKNKKARVIGLLYSKQAVNYLATCRSRISSSVLQSMHKVAVGRASKRFKPISTPQPSQ